MISPLVRDLEIGLHLVSSLGHSIDEQSSESLIDAKTEKGNLPICVLLQLLLVSQETSTLIRHLKEK